MSSFPYSKYKKRVVSTLFLYLIILLLGCDFKSPEEWENPAWYTDLTLPLVNKEFSFGGLLSDTIFYSDTLDVALPSDTVSEVIHLNYSVIMPPVQIPDEIFDIDMSVVDVTIPDFSDMGDPIPIPPIPDFTQEIPILEDFDTGETDCFLKSVAELIVIPEFSEDLPTDNFPVGNDFLEIRKIYVDNMTWNMQVDNSLPFPIKIEFSIKNGDASLFTAEGLENIDPETSASSTQSNSPDSLDLTKKLTFTVKTSIVADRPTTCSILGEEGWDITAEEASLSVSFGYDIGLIDSVLLFTSGIDETKKSQNPIMGGEDKLEIFRAKISETTVEYPNKIFLEITNDFFLPSDLTLTFENFFDSVGIDQWEHLLVSIELEPSTTAAESVKDTIDYSGFILAATIPDPLIDVTEGDPITSIDLNLSVKIDSGEVTIRTTQIDGKSYITQTGPQFSIEISNMSLEYIEAITHQLPFTAPPSPPIGGIPDGFTDIEFVDLKLGMDLFNEIGIPMKMHLNVEGSRRGFDPTQIDIDSLEIGVPYGGPDPHDCVFEPIGDTARTVILLTKDILYTAYYCNNDISDSTDTPLGEESDLVGLINIVPEQISISGEVILNGEGRVARGTAIWGTIIIDTPLSFIFKKQMTIIPSAPWPLAPIDDPETSEKINSSLIEGEFFVDITNRSSLGGSLSLLISDSTIFPLFLDSLITGTWEGNRQHQMTEWNYYFLTDPETATNQPWAWDSLGIEIDSISYTAIDPSDDKSKALEVQFFHQDSLQFFVGRMFEVVFPPADSIDYSWGYATPAFPGLYSSSVKLDTTILSWLISDQPRNSTAMITFDGSPYQLNDTTFTPVTLQTTHAIAVQAYLTLKLDTGGLIE